MQEFEGIKVLFVAGFGPIVGDRVAGRKLYGETLNISFKEEQGHAQNFAHWNWLQSERSCVLADHECGRLSHLPLHHKAATVYPFSPV